MSRVGRAVKTLYLFTILLIIVTFFGCHHFAPPTWKIPDVYADVNPLNHQRIINPTNKIQHDSNLFLCFLYTLMI